jgi:hypothetical protein
MRVLAMLLAGLGAANAHSATVKPDDRFGIPPLEFAVDLNRQENRFLDGETRRVVVNGKTVTATLELKPTRLLQTPDFSFRFPNQAAFERDPDADTWTITPGNRRIIVGRSTDKSELAAGVDPVLRQIEADMGKGSLGPSEILLGGRRLPGRILRGRRGKDTYEVEGYFIPLTGDAHYYLLIMQVSTGDPSEDSLAATARRMLVDTFAFGSVRRGTASAPLEFVLKLDGASLDVSQDRPRKTTVGGAPVDVLVTAFMRVLRTPELALRYPEFYEFTGHADTKDGSDRWQMQGRQQMVLLIRTQGKADAPKAAQRVIDELAKSLGRPSATKPVETTFAGEARKGTRAEFKKNALTIASEVFPFIAGEAGYVLAFHETTRGGEVPPNDAFFRKSIEESLTLAE